MKSLGRSHFAGLANYITDSQSKDHRLGSIQLTNCESGNLQAAIEEILATQHQNTRAKSDRTCHLIVSFRAGEQPSNAVLKAIEARICTGLGYGEHQRISAVHHDTDNLHIHLAINKIHPARRTIHEPYYPHRKLAALCEILERDYGLEPDNHLPNKGGSSAGAAAMEQHAGVESLVGWIKRTCFQEMRDASSWAQLHQVMSSNGLRLRERGNGLIVEASNGIAVKASTLARDLSKSALERRLGPFAAQSEQQAAAEQQEPVTPKRGYRKDPMPMRVDTTELYTRYQQDQSDYRVCQTSGYARAKARKDKALEHARRVNRLQRAAIKLVDGRQFSKRLLYAHAHKAMLSRLEAIHENYAKDRWLILEAHPRTSWVDWLKKEAINGCAQALKALRSRESARGLKGHTVTGRGKASPGQGPEVDNITKKGTYIFKGGKSIASAIRDDGQQVQVSRGANKEAVKAALVLAAQRYGNQIHVDGTAEFKAQLIWVAAESNLPITFFDPGLERRRQFLLTKKEQSHAQATREQAKRGRSDRRSTGGSGPVHHPRDSTVRPFAGRPRSAPRTREENHSARTFASHQLHVGPIGKVPPAHSQHCLRTLSQLGVVQFTPGGEVLLPRDVPHHLEHQRSKPDHKLRRIEFDLVATSKAWAAARRYIRAEASKFLEKKDITKISGYTADSKPLVFAGTRSHEGQSLALFKRDLELMVLPMSVRMASLLSQVAVGDVVRLAPRGAIRNQKGRSR